MEDPTLTVGGNDGVRFSLVDYVVFVLLLTASVVLGMVSAYRARKNPSASDYLMGGRSMAAVPIALSLLGGVMSAIAILGFSAESYFYGTQYSVVLVGMALGGLLVNHVTLPILYNLKLVSINHYLELRFQSATLRYLGSVCQILSMVMMMAVIMYAPALALSTATGLNPQVSVLSTSAVCILYTTIGGVRGVVYTDVLQTTVMFLGMLVIVVVGTMDQGGGPTHVWTTALQGHRVQFFDFNPDPYQRHTFWSTIVLGMYLTFYFFGVNQASYQRLSAVNSLGMAKRLLMVAVIGIMVLLVVCTAAGLVAYAVYNGCDPLAAGRITKQDQILPYLVVDKLGHFKGIPGVFVAAIYGGVLSSLSTSCNSLACIVWDDFLLHVGYFRSMGDRGSTTVLKVLSFLFGVVGMGLALTVGHMGIILQLAQRLLGAINGPLMGIFITGICAPWVGHWGATIGFLTSLALNLAHLIGSVMSGKTFPPTLPLSTNYCNNTNLPTSILSTTISTNNLFTTTNILTTTTSNLFTTISNNLSTATTSATPIITTIMEGANDVDAPSRSVYDVSYCYQGVMAIIITIIVSSITSIFTGLNSPEDIEEGLAHPLGISLHRFLWRVQKYSKGYVVKDAVKEVEDAEANERGLKYSKRYVVKDEMKEGYVMKDAMKEGYLVKDAMKEAVKEAEDAEAKESDVMLFSTTSRNSTGEMKQGRNSVC